MGSALIRKIGFAACSITCRRAGMPVLSSWMIYSCKAFSWSDASLLPCKPQTVFAGGCLLSRDQSLCTGAWNSYAILFQLKFCRVSSAAMGWVTRFSTSAKVSGIVVGSGGPKLVGQYFEIWVTRVTWMVSSGPSLGHDTDICTCTYIFVCGNFRLPASTHIKKENKEVFSSLSQNKILN